MEATEPSLNALAGYGFIFGVAAFFIAVLLWRASGGGGNGVGAVVLPKFLAGAIIFSMVSAAVWWATRA